jgi:hypothetical protein
MGNRDKNVKACYKPSNERQPRTLFDKEQSKHKELVWRFSEADRNGPFSWLSLDAPAAFKEVMDKLTAYELVPLTAYLNSGSHEVEMHALSKEAQRRLAEIEKDDLDSLYSLRISGSVRVWCIREDNLFKVLWFDPEHQVCLSKKKHT